MITKTLTVTGLTLALFSKAYALPDTLKSDLVVCTSKKALTTLEGALTNRNKFIVNTLLENGFCLTIPKDSKVEKIPLQKFEGLLYNDSFYYTDGGLLDKALGWVSL